MTPLHNLKRSLGTLLALGLILLVSLFVVRSLAGLGTQPATNAVSASSTTALSTGIPETTLWATNTPQGQDGAHPATPTLNSPTEIPVAAAGKRPPACTFPLADIKPVESQPETYVFSEPKVVSISNDNDKTSIELVDWLPNNQQVLLVQNYNSNKQTIELFNPQTGTAQIYAEREWTEQHPYWNQELGAVVYPVRHIVGMNGAIPDFTRQAWISFGDPQSAKMIADHLSQFSIAVKPNGKEFVYLKEKQIAKRVDLLKDAVSIPFDLEQWNYRNMKSGVLPLEYKMAWRPGTSQIFLYSFANGAPGYTFILNIDTGEICELNINGWAVLARWSPDSRYLAVDMSQNSERPVDPTILVVLDTLTGYLYTSEVVPKELPGIHTVSGIAWAPDNRHLLVLGSALSFPHCAPNCYEETKLYLVDFFSGQVDPILSDYQFISNNAGTNLAWSSDGSKIIALCPALCKISVQVSER